MRTLQKKIADRIAEAERKQIAQKAEFVATTLGTKRALEKCHIFTKAKSTFRIVFTSGHEQEIDGEPYERVTVTYAGRIVFEKDLFRGITAYIPGKWEHLLDRLAESSDRMVSEQVVKDARRQKSALREAEAREAQKWGL